MKEILERLIESNDIEELSKYLNAQKAKKIVIDIADLPTGLSVEQFMYYFNQIEIDFIDSNDKTRNS